MVAASSTKTSPYTYEYGLHCPSSPGHSSVTYKRTEVVIAISLKRVARSFGGWEIHILCCSLLTCQLNVVSRDSDSSLTCNETFP